MRVLITGAGGFMGSHVMRHLLEKTNWELILIDSFRHAGKTDRITTQLKDQNVERVSVYTHDLKAPISAQMAGHIGKIDYILNIASESHVDRSIETPREFIENNVMLMLTMLEYARQYPVEKFIQISTDEVFGPAPDGYLHKETDPHRPSNPYSASKAAQEDLCFTYWRTYDLPIIITNTMNIFGEMQDPEKFIPKVIKAIQSGQVVPIHASKEGRVGTRFYLHARNQADALLHLLRYVTPNRYGDNPAITRFNIVGEREVSNLELAGMIAGLMGKGNDWRSELVDFHSSRPGHDLRYALDGGLLTVNGWTPPMPFLESLRKTVEWTLAHPEWLQ